jgi:hypothetical protein
MLEVFILVKHEGGRRRWGSIPLSLYYSNIKCISHCYKYTLANGPMNVFLEI